MKRISIIISFVFLFLVVSSYKVPNIQMEFDAPVSKNSNGMVIASIDIKTEKICLFGSVSLSEGAAAVYLIDSHGVTLYSKILYAP